MTTLIACLPLGIMVSDSCVSHGSVQFRSRKKVRRSGKFVGGVAGDFGPALAYLAKFAAAARSVRGQEPPALPAYEGEFELMVLGRDGIWLYGQDGTPIEVEEEIYAIGSGGAHATGALAMQERMLMAYDLEAAMEVACDLDPASQLPMVEVSLQGSATLPRSSQ